MGFSRSARIITLLVIDTVFFFVELITGYAVGSLALVADSFHMLNDVLSLVVALYTIKLATSPSSAANSYGWQRAEILGALINGVFLVALCVSIALEAVGRVFAPPEISNPKIIVFVGCLGLLSNVVGLFLFHEHGHSHGHSHGEGGIKLPDDEADIEGNGDGVVRRSESIDSLPYQHPAQTRAQVIETAAEFGYGQSSSSDFNPMSPPSSHHHRAGSQTRRHTRTGSNRPRAQRTRSGNSPSVSHLQPPAPGSNETKSPTYAAVAASGDAPATSTSGSSSTAVEEHNHDHDHDHDHDHGAKGHKHKGDHKHDANKAHNDDHDHDHDHGDGAASGGHGHSHGGGGGGHGHSHGSMNMRGVFLHVLGDALGNVGVIAAGLVLWFCEGRWTLYFDPGVSLLITMIILSSALPLVKSASYILMQAVPSHVSLDDVRESLYDVDGVVSVHELHIWQLSESTVVASVHVLIQPGVDYMVVANGIRHVLHGHGIHSVTIQPEFYTEAEASQVEGGTSCLIQCPPEQCGTDTCCPPGREDATKLVGVEERDETASGSGGSPRK